jgi:hypothetical protein
MKKVVTANKKKRVDSDFNIPISIKLHADGRDARKKMAKMFRGQYKNFHLDTFAFFALERLVTQYRLVKGDDLEGFINQ